MEEPDIPWQMDEYSPEENKDCSRVNWILHKGFVIGKKMLVTGIVITSAPVVLPPLVMISALGFAVSVPYGIILASYTCSEKLLNKLLPNTSPPFSLKEDSYFTINEDIEDDHGFGGSVDMEEEQEKQSDEMKENLNIRTGMSTASEEPSEMVVVGYQTTNRDSPTAEQPTDITIQGVMPMAEAHENDPCKPEIVEASIEIADVFLLDGRSGKGNNLEGVLMKETTGLISGLGAEGIAEDSVQENNKNLEHGVIDNVEITTEAKSNEKKSKRKGRKRGKVDERKLPKSSVETAEIMSGGSTCQHIAEEEKAMTEIREQKSAEDVKQTTATGIEAEKEHPHQAKDDHKIKTSAKVPVHSPLGVTSPKGETNLTQKVIFPSCDEGMFNEETIWQKIKAMRLIMGYKAAHQASCMEELKALYLFTGVVPPAPFKDASDPVEVNEKLQFLMSVVGVK